MALEGWRDFRENGLVVLEALEKATSEYKSESDTLTAFICDKCKPYTVANVHTTRLFQSFKEWTKENNES